MISKAERAIVRNAIVKIGLNNLPNKFSLICDFILKLIKNDILVDDCEYLSQLQPLYYKYFMMRIKYKKICKNFNVIYSEDKFDDLTLLKNGINNLWESINNRYLLTIYEEMADSESDSDIDWEDEIQIYKN